MDVIVDRVAGLDVHKKTVMAAVRTPGADLAADVATELENVLRSQLIARSAEDVAGEARTEFAGSNRPHRDGLKWPHSRTRLFA